MSSVFDPAPTRVCSNPDCRTTAPRAEFTAPSGRILKQCAACRRKIRVRVERYRLRRAPVPQFSTDSGTGDQP